MSPFFGMKRVGKMRGNILTILVFSLNFSVSGKFLNVWKLTSSWMKIQYNDNKILELLLQKTVLGMQEFSTVVQCYMRLSIFLKRMNHLQNSHSIYCHSENQTQSYVLEPNCIEGANEGTAGFLRFSASLLGQHFSALRNKCSHAQMSWGTCV